MVIHEETKRLLRHQLVYEVRNGPRRGCVGLGLAFDIRIDQVLIWVVITEDDIVGFVKVPASAHIRIISDDLGLHVNRFETPHRDSGLCFVCTVDCKFRSLHHLGIHAVRQWLE